MITLKNIDMTLDPASIDKAIQAINDFKSDLKWGMIAVVNDFAKLGVQIAKAELLKFDKPAYYTGELSKSIEAEKADMNDPEAVGTAHVCAYAEYAIYVEYGTGIYAAESKRGGEPWAYFNERDGKWHVTRGMPARPFMYNTLRILQNYAETEGAEVLARYISS